MSKHLDKDWVSVNWEFLKSARQVRIPSDNYVELLSDPEAPSQGKFYGSQAFIATVNPQFRSRSFNGTPRLFMRPYIYAVMPQNSIKAVFINPKDYDFDEEGRIAGFSSSYQAPIFIFEE